jgi:hypothetical protein
VFSVPYSILKIVGTIFEVSQHSVSMWAIVIYRFFSANDSMRMVRCGICGNKWVPEMLIASIEPPAGLAIMGKGAFIQARVCRQRRKGNGDVNATIVSDALPFLEYELYRQVGNIVRMPFLLTNMANPRFVHVADRKNEGPWRECSLRL